MIALLVVDSGAEREFSPPPSFEILHAATVPEACEKLARNRRIDAVLFFEERLAREVSRILREEDPAAPPLFLAGAGRVTGVEAIAPGHLFEELAFRLGET